MNEPYPPLPGQVPPPRRGLGCFATGCIVLAVLFVLGLILIGAGGWYLYNNTVRPFLDTKPVAIQVSQASPEQYAALADRFQTFMNALSADQAATLTLSADDLNTAVAYAPAAKDLRGRVHFAINGDDLVVESSYPLSPGRRGAAGRYFNGRVHFAASYSSGEFNFLLRKLETLGGKPTPPLIDSLTANPNFVRSFSQSFSESFNQSFRAQTDRNPDATRALARLRTITVQDGQLILTSQGDQPTPPGQPPSR